MQTDTTYLSPQTVISNGQYTGNPWNNAGNLLSVSGGYATTPATSTLGSDVVLGNFLFNIPANSNISGIEISFNGYRDAGADPATALQVYAYDNTDGNNFFYEFTPVFSNFTTSSVTYYFGSPSYLFNTTWTTDQINNLKIRLQANGLLFIRGLQVRVTYQAPGGTTTVTQDVCGSLFQAQPFRLQQPVGGNNTENLWLVDKFQTSDGVDITNADIIAPGIPITTDQGNQNEENQYVTHVQATSGGFKLITVTRGWSFRDPIVQSGPYRPHGSGAEIIISNSVPFYDVFIRKCQIGSLVSAPIYAYDESVLITSYLRSLNFVGAGVVATGVNASSGGGKDVTVTIPGFSTTPPVIVNSGGNNTGGIQVTTITDPNVTTTGTDRYLLVAVSMEGTALGTGVTFNGVGMTLVGSHTNGSVRVELWGLLAPALGTHPLIINTNSLTFLSWEWVQSTQTTSFTFGAGAGATTNLSTGSDTTTISNSLVIHALATKLVGINYTAGGGEALVSTQLTGAVQGAIQTQAVGTPATVTSDIALSASTNWANVLGTLNGIQVILSPISTQDEGVTVDSNTIQYNFVGAGVTASQTAPGFVDVTIPGGGGGSGEVVQKTFTQTAHGFTASQVLKSSGTDGEFALAEADVVGNADVIGVLSSVVNANNFVLTTEGFVILTVLPGGSVAGSNLFLSPSTPGLLTLTDPAIANVPGTVSKPLVSVINAATGLCYVHNYRGQEQQSTVINDVLDNVVHASESSSGWITTQLNPSDGAWSGIGSPILYGNGVFVSSAAGIKLTNGLVGYTNTSSGGFSVLRYDCATSNPGKLIKLRFEFGVNALNSSHFMCAGFMDTIAGNPLTTTVDKSIRFVATNSTIFAVTSDGTTNTHTDLVQSIGLTNPHILEIVWNPGTNVEFYVDGVLAATHTTGIPVDTTVPLIWFEGTGGAGPTAWISGVVVSQQL